MGEVIVIAEASGTVVRIESAPGAEVAEDDAIVTLEGPDAEIPIEAGVEGVVQDVFVEEGDEVDEGDEIAVIET